MDPRRHPLRKRAAFGALAMIGWAFSAAVAEAQLVVINETFTGTTASPSWQVGGSNYTPTLTAATGIDSPGSGWLRLTSAGGQQATYAYDTESFNGANATIAVKFSYAAYGGTGADGITFFLADASKTFAVGAYGGSLGYAQKTLAAGGEADIQGMSGGYIGLGIDEFGNYSNATEGRIGGEGFLPGNVSIRGPGQGYTGYDYLGGTGQLETPIAFSGTSRPTGDNARIFQVEITATNQLTVYMQAGATAPMEALYSIDLSGYARPEDLIMGFTGSTGGSTNIHEIQGLSLTSLKADLWTNGAGTSTWANGGNWDGTDGQIPEIGADILLDNHYVSSAQTIDVGSTRIVRSVQIDAPFSYTLNNGTLEFANQGVLGPSGIFVSQGNGAAVHTISSELVAQNAIDIKNTGSGLLNLTGSLTTNGHAVGLSGTGQVSLSGIISGEGSITKNGAGTAILSGDNTYSGGTTLRAGTLTAGHNNAFGTGELTIRGGTLASNAGNTIGNAISLQGNAGLSNILTSGTLTQSGENRTLTLSNATHSGAINLSENNTGRTLTVGVDLGSSTLSGVIQNGGNAAGSLTKTGTGTLVLSGANTYTGTTSINAGTLQLGASDRLANASSVSIGASGTLNLNGYSDQVGALTALGGATLNFGTTSGANTFIFGNYTPPASGVLVVNNWEQNLDKLATTTAGQTVSSVYFSGFGVAQQAASASAMGGSYGNAYLLTPVAAPYKEWDGSSSTTWSTNNNWTSPTEPNTNEIALFDALGIGRTNANLTSSDTVAGIRFGTGASVSYSLTSSNNRTLTLAGIVPYIQQQSANSQSISITTLALNSTAVADITGAGDLTISSRISGTGAALIKDGKGAGKLILSGNNTFTGGLYVNSGTVRANSNTALGTGAATLSDGTTLEISGGRTLGNAVSLSGAGVGDGGALRSVAGANTLSGTITETGATTLAADGGTTLSLTGNLTGTGSDTTLIGAGNITLNQITTGSGSVNLNGTGTVTYAGGTAANTYTGATNVNSGTLVLGKTAGTNAVAGALTIGDGAGATSSATVRLGAANQIANTTAVEIDSDGLFNLSGFAETVAAISGSGRIDNTSGTATTLTFGDTSSTTFSGLIHDTGGNLSLVKLGAGKLTLTGANTYAGTTSLTKGIIAIQHNSALGTGAVTVSSGGNLELSGNLSGMANTIYLNGPGTLANDGAIQSTAGDNTLTGAITLQSASRIMSDSGSTLTIQGAIGGAGQSLTLGGPGDIKVTSNIGTGTGGALTKDGSGYVTLSGANNTFTGATSINAGTLEIRTATGLGTTAGGTTVANGATLALFSTGSLAIGETALTLSGQGVNDTGALRNLSGTNTVSGAIALNASTSIGVDSGSLTASGVISGAASNDLTKTGAGTLQLSGGSANTFSGNLNVNDGTLILAKTAGVSATGPGNLTIGDGAGAANSAVVQLNTASQIGSTAAVTLASDGRLNLNNQTQAIGSIAGSGSVTLGSGALTVGTAGVATDMVFSGSASGAGTITKTGTGTLSLAQATGSNAFAAGTLVVSQGTVELGASNILSDTSTLRLSGGTFKVGGDFSDLVGNLSLTATSTIDYTNATSSLTFTTATRTGGVLIIDNWAGDFSGGGASQLFFGNAPSGFATATDIVFTGYAAGFTRLASGEIVPNTGLTYSWNVSGSGTWATDANWTPDPTGTGIGPNAVGASVALGGKIAADSTITVAGTKTLGYLSFNDNNRYTLSGGSLTMDVGSGSAQINVSNSGGGTIASALTLNDNLILNQNSSGAFTVSGGISGTARNITVAGSGETTLSGVIATTTGTLTKNGTGTLTLGANNTFTGATTVNSGTLAISNENNLGANPGALNAGQLTLNGGTLRTTTNAVTIDDTRRGVTIGANGGTFETLSDLTIGSAGSANNAVAINGTLTKTGAGTLTFAGTGANTGTGAINIEQGTLAVTKSTAVSAFGDTASVTVGASGTLRFTGSASYTAETIGSLSGSGIVTNTAATALALNTGGNGSSTTFSGSLQNGTAALSLIKSGAGTFTLSGNNSYTGATTVSQGALRIQHNNGLGATTAGTTVASGAALELQGDDDGAIAIGAEALALTGTGIGATGALRNISGNNSLAGAVTLSGTNTEIQSDAGTLTLSGNITGAAQNLTLDGAGSTRISGNITTTTGTLTKTGSGHAVLLGNNSYTGATNVSGGILEISGGGTLGTNASGTTVAAGATLALSNGAATADTLTVNGVGFGSAGALRSLNGTNTVSGAVSLATSSLVGVDSGTLTVSGIVSGNGTSLTKVGAGTLVLSNTNTYSGGTVVNAGTVQVNADTRLGAVPGAVSASNITLNGGTLATTFTGTLATNRGVSLGSAGGTLETVGATTLTYGGVVAGSGALTKSGAGTLTLTGTNTYSGGTVFAGGRVNINSDARLGAAPSSATTNNLTFTGGTLATSTTMTLDANRGINVAAGGGALNVANATTLTFGGTITGEGGLSLALNSTGILNLISDIDFSAGTLLLGGGTLRLAGIDLSVGTFRITGNTILDFTGVASTITAGNFIIDAGATLTVNNWANGVDFFLADHWWTNAGMTTEVPYNTRGSAPMNQIVFSGFTGAATGWVPYDQDYAQISPVPEPSTYGAIFLGLCVAVFGWRRWSKKSPRAAA